MSERETKKEERLPYSPPTIVFESHVEALAAACNPPDGSNCPNKDTAGTTCAGVPPGNCSALKS